MNLPSIIDAYNLKHSTSIKYNPIIISKNQQIEMHEENLKLLPLCKLEILDSIDKYGNDYTSNVDSAGFNDWLIQDFYREFKENGKDIANKKFVEFFDIWQNATDKQIVLEGLRAIFDNQK